MPDKERVKIPAFAKISKNNAVYALKRDMPYFQDEKDVKGSFVIGHLSDQEGYMIPDFRYGMYCTPASYERKKQKQKEEQERREAEERKQKEEEEERERNLGRDYISLEETWDSLRIEPVKGYLAEQFFHETGIGSILTKVLGKERAYWIRLSSAVIAGEGHNTFDYEFYGQYPMEDHMEFSMHRRFSLEMWGKIKEEEIHQILSELLAEQKPEHVSALSTRSTVSLFHNDASDSYGDWFFIQRLKPGTHYDKPYLFYRNEDTGRLIALEPLNYRLMNFDMMKSLLEIQTIQNSAFSVMQNQNVSLHYYMNPYQFETEIAVKAIPSTICMHTTEYENQKEMKKILSQLEDAPVNNKRRILRWEGTYHGISGHWMLIENTEKRKWMVEDASSFLKRRKKYLQAMGYYAARRDQYADYFEIDKGDNDAIFLDVSAASVKNAQGALNMFKQDAGRFLYFSNDRTYADEELLQMQWKEEDIRYQMESMINHGETESLTDEFAKAMPGRDLSLFLAQMYREWIYEHIGKYFNEDFDVYQFADLAGQYQCSVSKDGTVKSQKINPRLSRLLREFHVDKKMLVDYVKQHIIKPKYFSDEFQ